MNFLLTSCEILNTLLYMNTCSYNHFVDGYIYFFIENEKHFDEVTLFVVSQTFKEH